jgi:hypothetical protein
MIRVCVAECFHACDKITPTVSPKFVRYAHSCAKDNCLAQCDATILLTKHVEDDSISPWSLNNTTCINYVTWFCDKNPHTRFLLKNNLLLQKSRNSIIKDVTHMHCVDVDGNTLTPKYEPRVPVTEQVVVASKQHLRLSVRRDTGNDTALHVILCNGGDEVDLSKLEHFDVGDEPVILIRLCHENTGTSQNSVYLGEIPGISRDDSVTNCIDYFMQFEWFDTVKCIQVDTIESKLSDDTCILSAIIGIELK